MINELIKSLAKTFDIPKYTVVTILITLFTFISGIVINLTLSAIKDFKQRRIHRKLAALNHRHLLRTLYKQTIYIGVFEKQLTIDYTGSFTFTYQQIPALEVFFKIGYENLYKAYFRGFENFRVFDNTGRIKAFNNLWSIIEYVNHTNDTSFKRVDKFEEKNSSLNEARNLALAKAQNVVEKFRIQFHKKLTSKEPLGDFFDQREKIIKKFRDAPDYTNPVNVEQYMQALLNLNRANVDLISRYENDIHSVELNTYLLEASYRFHNMKNHYGSVHHYFSHLSETYLENCKKLKDSYRILNPRHFNFKKWWDKYCYKPLLHLHKQP